MVEIKLPLYADDMMIYTENPKKSIKKNKLPIALGTPVHIPKGLSIKGLF